MKNLADRVAIVTGASRGIGRAIANRLAADGASIVIHYREDGVAARKVFDGILASGGKAAIVQADLASPDGVAKLFGDFNVSPLGHRLDILVNNAAVSHETAFENVGDADYDRIMNLNLRAPFFAAQQAAARMKDWGRIISIGALSAHRAMGAFPMYGMAKAAIVSMTAALAQQLGPRGITVNAISPGAIDTDMAAFMMSDKKAVERMAAATPLRRIGQPDDIASVAAFLASDDSRWVTGQTIIATGGVN